MAGRSLGDQLKAVFAKVGIKYTIVRSTGNITGESLDYTQNRQVTKPFTIEHQLEVELAYDSQVVIGDLLWFQDGRRYLVGHMDPNIFRGTELTRTAQLFKCNAQINLYHPTTTGTFERITTWSPVATAVYVVLVSKDYGARDDFTPDPISRPDRATFQMWTQRPPEMVIGDRVEVIGSSRGLGPGGIVRLSVETIDQFTYRGLDLIYLSEDARV